MQFELFASDGMTMEVFGNRATPGAAPGTLGHKFDDATVVAAAATVGTREPASDPQPRKSQTALLGPNKPPAEVECKMIVSALRATCHEEFVKRVEPFLTNDDRERIALCSDMPYQLVNHAWNPLVERLNHRWGELQGGWSPFARVVESAEEIAGLRVMTLDLIKPSRGLEGQVAFAVSRQLHEVAQPIPLSVLELVREACREGWLQAVAFLEPIFGPGRKRREIMRSQAQVQRTHARLIDPLVVGFLGAGPAYSMRERITSGLGRRNAFSWSTSLIRATQFVWCLGHWD